MRFGKRLALAMIRDAGEAPYISQKELKHILVGLEKLCKSLSSQQLLLNTLSTSQEDAIVFANTERLKFGLSEKPSILDEGEVVSHDASFFALIDSDITRIRRYVESCESALMMTINDWLEEAESRGWLFPVTGGSVEAIRPDIDATAAEHLRSEFHEIQSEHMRLKQYVDVNIAGLRKLISRRNKNVPEVFWSVVDCSRIHEIKTPEYDSIVDMIIKLEQVLS